MQQGDINKASSYKNDIESEEKVMTKTAEDDAPFTEDIPVIGKRLFGLGRAASYAAAKEGVIPTIRVGRRLRGLTRVLEQRLNPRP